ncbi:MAG: hypothetical protein V4695_06535 [Pseudomonadota bacterium]
MKTGRLSPSILRNSSPASATATTAAAEGLPSQSCGSLRWSDTDARENSSAAGPALKKRRLPGASTDFKSLPKELHRRLAKNFTAGTGDTVRLGTVNKALRESLQDQVWLERLIHRARCDENGVPRTVSTLQQVLQDPDLLDDRQRPLRLRATILAEAISQIAAVCRSHIEAGEVLLLGATVLERIHVLARPQDEQTMANLLYGIAQAFPKHEFARAVSHGGAHNSQVAPTTQEFYRRFKAIATKWAGETPQQMETATVSGLYMINDPDERVAVWQHAFAERDPSSPHDPAMVVALARELGYLPLQPARESARLALMRLLPDLAPSTRAKVISALTAVVVGNRAHPDYVQLVSDLWGHGMAIDRDDLRAGVIATTTKLLRFMQSPIRYERYSATAVALTDMDPAEKDLCVPELAKSIAYLPQLLERSHAVVQCANSVPVLSEPERIQTLTTLVPMLDHVFLLPTQRELFSQFCHDVQQLPANNRNGMIYLLSSAARLFPPSAERQCALGDLLLLIGQTEGAALKNHLLHFGNDVKNITPSSDALNMLHWVLVTANRLPDRDRADVFSAVANQAFSSINGMLPAKIVRYLCAQTRTWPAVEAEIVRNVLQIELTKICMTVREGVQANRPAALQIHSFRALCSTLQQAPEEIVAPLVDSVAETVRLAHASGKPYAREFMSVLRVTRLQDRCMARLTPETASALGALLRAEVAAEVPANMPPGAPALI